MQVILICVREVNMADAAAVCMRVHSDNQWGRGFNRTCSIFIVRVAFYNMVDVFIEKLAIEAAAEVTLLRVSIEVVIYEHVILHVDLVRRHVRTFEASKHLDSV